MECKKIIYQVIEDLKKESFIEDRVWVITDIDSEQCRKRTGRYQVSFMETLYLPEGEVEIKEEEIDFRYGVDLEDLVHSIKTYYSSVKHFYDEVCLKDCQQFLLLSLECYWEQEYMRGKY